MNGKCVWIAAVTFAVTLAALIVERLDNQALALLTGAACGVVAGVPITAFVFWLSQRQPLMTRAPYHEPREQPQVIVVQSPPQPPPAPSWQPPSYQPLPPARPPREFNIIGDEEDDNGSA